MVLWSSDDGEGVGALPLDEDGHHCGTGTAGVSRTLGKVLCPSKYDLGAYDLGAHDLLALYLGAHDLRALGLI